MTKKINIKSVEDANELSDFASKCSVDTFVHGLHESVNAKSLLGLISLVGNPNLVFVVPENKGNERIFKKLPVCVTV